MAEFSEVIKQFKRLCMSINPVTCNRGECPMGCKNIGQCRKLAFERPFYFEKRVMDWAAENPEPQYPTWYEYLTDMYPVAWNMIKDKPIPADIAQKLGIEPEEG